MFVARGMIVARESGRIFLQDFVKWRRSNEVIGGDQRLPGPLTKGLDLKGCLIYRLLTTISFISSYDEWPGHNQIKH